MRRRGASAFNFSRVGRFLIDRYSDDFLSNASPVFYVPSDDLRPPIAWGVVVN